LILNSLTDVVSSSSLGVAMKGVVVGSEGSGYHAAEDEVVVREVKRRRLVKVLFAVRAWKLVRFGVTEETTFTVP